MASRDYDEDWSARDQRKRKSLSEEHFSGKSQKSSFEHFSGKSQKSSFDRSRQVVNPRQVDLKNVDSRKVKPILEERHRQERQRPKR